MMCTRVEVALTLLLLFGTVESQAQSTVPRPLRDVGFDQRLNEQVPLELYFRDETGRSVRLGEYYGTKPVILVLAYYECPMLCTVVLNNLTQALRDVPFDIGREFAVVTVSFDPRETPELAAAKQRTYVGRYGRPGAAAGWHFLTGEQDAIDALTRAVGFRYHYDEPSGQFAHASGIMVLTPAGKISRYFYDVRYAPRDLRLGLVEAARHEIGSPVDRVLLFCFHYDPAEGRYGPAVMRLVRGGGVVTFVVIVVALAWLFRSGARRPSITPGGSSASAEVPRSGTRMAEDLG